MSRFLCCVALVLLVVLPTSSFGDSDVVGLTNGDRLTGTVRRFDRGLLVISAGPAGRVEIEWSAVATITSTQRFQIELMSGERFYGTIQSPSAGHIQVQAASGPVMLEMKNIIRLSPIANEFWRRTAGSVELGFSLTSPPDVTTSYALDAEAQHRSHAWMTDATLESLLDRSQGKNIQSRNLLDLDARRLLTRRWFAIGMFQAQNDKFLALGRRIVAGGGLGETVIQSEQTNVALFGGLNYNGERFTAPSLTNRSAEALGGVKWDWFPAGVRADLNTSAKTFVSLQRPRVRLEIDSELKDYVFRKLFWSFTVFESFDSDPRGNRNQSDFGAEIMLGWKF